MKVDIKSLTVLYKDRIVGYLNQNNDSTITFQYDKQWLINGFSISPISLPLTNTIYISKSKELNGLYGVFWDCLPQGWGQHVLQKQLLKCNIDYSKLDLLTKLSFSTNSPRGGLRFEPNQLKVNESKRIDLDNINSIAIKVINNKAKDNEKDKLLSFTSNSGGAKPKIHVEINNQSWIIKLNTGLVNLTNNEYQSNRLAMLAGIDVNEFKLFKSKSGSKYFGVKRFDRDINNEPIHMISLCGILETTPQIPNLDYYTLFQVINKISVNKIEDLYEAYTRMVFNVLYGNKDDHGCNWSFLYDETLKGYKLSPFYDITYTADTYPEHEMSVLSKGNPSIGDMLELAHKFNLSIDKCKKIINKVQSVLKGVKH